MRVWGIVTSGVRRGAKYVSMKTYKEFLCKKLGCSNIYNGTLNIKLLAKTWRDIPLKQYCPNNQCSPVLYAKARLKNDCVLILRPIKSVHSDDIIEIIAQHNLREKYGLQDGDKVEIEIEDM